MTHLQIQENNIADRYVMQKLSLEERSGFEEHLVDCEECLDRVETLARFRRGLQAAARRDEARGHILAEGGFLLWFHGLSRNRQAALATFVLILFLGPATLLYITQVRRIHRELERAQAAYAELNRRYTEQQAANKREESAGEKREPVVAGVDHEHAGADQPTLPSGSLPLYTLSIVRDPSNQSAPSNQIRISSSSPNVILSLEFEPVPGAQSYRSKLFRHGRIVWSERKLTVSGTDTIAVILSTRLLAAGNYMLQLEGCSQNGVCYPSAKYSFHVTTANY